MRNVTSSTDRRRCSGSVFRGASRCSWWTGDPTDRTRAIIDEMARSDSRLRVFDNPRRARPSGLNVALAHARGRWVARMDAHTTYPPDYVALGVARLREATPVG